MSETLQYDIPWIGGVNRNVEASDKPPFLPSDLRDMRMLEDGAWETRIGTETEYGNRGNHFQFTTPLGQRGIASAESQAWGADKESLFYLSHKRKVWAFGESGADRYVFLGVVYSTAGHPIYLGERQQFRIYRGKILSDGYTVEWQGYENNQPNASVTAKYDPSTDYIEYSMVMDYAKAALVIALVLKEVAGVQGTANHSLLNTIKVTDLYSANWGSDTNADGWTSDGATWALISQVEALSGDVNLTHDIDLSVSATVSANLFRLAYGLEDLSLPLHDQRFYLKFQRKSNHNVGNWTGAFTHAIDNRDLHGLVIKDINNATCGIAFISYDNSTELAEIHYHLLTYVTNAFNAGGGGIASYSYWAQNVLGLIPTAAEWSVLGPSLAIDQDDTPVFLWWKEFRGALYCKVGTGGTEIRVTGAMPYDGEYPGNHTVWLLTGYDFIVRPNHLIVYFTTWNRGINSESGLAANEDEWQLWRRVLVYDSDDADYTDGTFFDCELVEDFRSATKDRHCFLCAYQRQTDTDPEKWIAFIRFYESDGVAELGNLPGGDQEVFNQSIVAFVRQDRGLSLGVQDVTMKQPVRYEAQSPDGAVKLTVLQCDDNRFYWRRLAGEGDWQFNLLEGQMSTGNEQIVRSTEVDGRAFFWLLNGQLRAGCGVGTDRDPLLNSPIVYQHIKRYTYANGNIDRAGSVDAEGIPIFDRYALNQRFFTLARVERPSYPDVVRAIYYIAGRDAAPLPNLRARLQINQTYFIAWDEGAAGNEITVEIITGPAENDLQRRRAIIRAEGKIWTTAPHNDTWGLVNDLNGGGQNVIFGRKIIEVIVYNFGGNDLDLTAETHLAGGQDGGEYEDFFTVATFPANFDRPRANSPDGTFVSFDPEQPLSHPFEVVVGDTFGARINRVPQPYLDVYFGFAFRLDNGQISQITLQESAQPFQIGFKVSEGSSLADQQEVIGSGVRLINMSLALRRWSALVDPGDPRRTALLIFMSRQMSEGQSAYDSMIEDGHLIKEVLIAKDGEPFKNDPHIGDMEWIPGLSEDEVVQYRCIIDLKMLKSTWERTEGVIDYIGHANPVYRSDTETPNIQGYKFAAAVNNRPFYLNLRINGQYHDDYLMWAGEAVGGSASFITPDVTGVEYVRRLPFAGTGLFQLAQGNLVLFGENDIEWGQLAGEDLSWRFIDTEQDLGSFASRSICKLAESFEGGGIDSAFFLNRMTGGHVFNLYEAPPVTDLVRRDFIAATNPSGTRTLTTIKGLDSLMDADAMALHLQGQRLLVIHFPDDGITFVRDFNAETNAGKGGMIWMRWVLTPNPKAWSQTPEQDLLYTDENLLSRWPRASDAKSDVAGATAIQPSGRLGDMKVPPDSFVVPYRAFVEFKLVKAAGAASDPALLLNFHKDDGNRLDMTLTFPYNTVRTRVTRGFALGPGRAEERIGVSWSLQNPGSASDFVLHNITLEMEKRSRWT